MFDLTARTTLRNLKKWHRDLSSNVENIPVVIVGNKSDDPDCKVARDELGYAKDKAIPYYEISCVTNQNVELPFLEIMRSLIGDPRLELMTAPSNEELEDIQYSEKDVVYLLNRC